ncbi:MAG: FtsH protease activity modulator HflK [Gammaproteobacteria bacterium]|nr:FtsH protease activity modulator HflK [Gammaproteobacteria bacterium]
MAWNEPGGGRDPWGGNGQKGPPDIEDALKKLQEKFSGIFGGKGTPSGTTGSGSGGGQIGAKGIGLILAILVAVWFVSGLYIVDPAEQGVVTRFGQYQRTVGEGPHWLPSLIETVEKVDVRVVRNAEIGFRTSGRSQGNVGTESLMLTQDENIIDVKFAVQYRVKDARDYLFNVKNPDITLRQATESAVREIVGKSSMDFVITGGRSEVASSSQTLIQEILDRYITGIVITRLNMQDAQPPAQVQDAFSDAVKAREDEVRQRNEAETYANDILPKARGDADALRELAEAYRQRVIALAQGDASRFLSVLEVYRRAPEVTRERLYLETVESVLANSSKILSGMKGGNNLLYLPLDQLVSRHRMEINDDTMSASGGAGSAGSPNGVGDRSRRQRESLRGGRSR